MQKKADINSHCNKIIAVGSHHADRFKVYSFLRDVWKERFFCHLFLKSPIQFYALKIFSNQLRYARIGDFKFYSLSTTAINEVTNPNDVILDIHHPKQSGLTLRAVDGLGKRMKIATTNHSILNYKACIQENIFLLDRNNPEISLQFMNKDRLNEGFDECIEKLGFENWFDVILGLSKYKLSDYTDHELDRLT